MGNKKALVEAILVEITLAAIKEVAKLALGGAEKKKRAAEIVVKKLNDFENIIPVLSGYLNNPGIDSLEKATIEYLIQVVYDNIYKE